MGKRILSPHYPIVRWNNFYLVPKDLRERPVSRRMESSIPMHMRMSPSYNLEFIGNLKTEQGNTALKPIKFVEGKEPKYKNKLVTKKNSKLRLVIYNRSILVFLRDIIYAVLLSKV